MLTRFLSSRAHRITSYLSTPSKAMHTTAQEPIKQNFSEGQAALNYVKQLCQEKKYKEALSQVTIIESKYPGCTKAAKFYRGEASIGLLEQKGSLKNLKPSI
jgi:hypothetical protein